MSGKARPSLRRKTLENVMRSNLSNTDKECIAEVFKRYEIGIVEVVRCKDCKHWLKDVAGCTDFVGRCEYANYMVGANGYCVYGEKALKEREKE